MFHHRTVCLCLAACVLSILFAGAPAGFAQVCPNPPVPSVTSSAVPADVCVPAGFPGNPIDFFDDYSWKTFIALVWPALTGQRGKPDTSQTAGGSGPRVFETYKSLYEVFHIDGSTPSPFNGFDKKEMNPCGVAESFGDITLASFSKFSNLGQAGFGTLVGPLIAQNRTYVRFTTGFNETEFNQILTGNGTGNGWYTRANLPATITFSDGSIDVKASWIDMTGIPNPSRYYTRTALLMDPATGNCSQTTVGLVGLHIVQKTPTRPQWIWSTFEQVDNVPPAVSGGPSTFNFNDGTATPMTSRNRLTVDPLPIPTPPPFNVTRIKPIHPQTTTTNGKYRSLLAGTPWEFYQLVMTQWPTTPSSPNLPGTPANTFPGTGATTAFANSTLETFEQANISTSCMACHATAQSSTDFVFSLQDHAFPSNVPNLLLANTHFKQLQSLLARATIPAAEAKARAIATTAKTAKSKSKKK